MTNYTTWQDASGNIFNATVSTPMPVQIAQSGSSPAISGAPFGNIDNSTAATIAVSAYNALYNGTAWDRQKKANAVNRLVSAAGTTNATSVKAAAGDLFKIDLFNTAAAARYLKLYNKASAPTVGTDTPIMTLYLPATSAFTFTMATPLYFSTGIAFALTVNAADADTTALTAGDVVALNIAYA